MTFSFDLNTFLSPRNNGGKSTNSNVLPLLNVSGLHNASQIPDNWLRVSGNAPPPTPPHPITYTLNISGKHLKVTLQVENYKVLCFNKNPFLKIHFSLIFKLDQQKASFQSENQSYISVSLWLFYTNQGLIQKEKLHIDCKKGSQINILANKIVT